MKLVTSKIESPVGELNLIASLRGLRAILWSRDRVGRVRLNEKPVVDRTASILVECAKQLDEYFSGNRKTFDLDLDVEGTEFQTSVWRVLRQIPHGETATYLEVARRLGRPTAARAVGMAVGRNPHSIVVPCHRIIGSNGALTGFAGGLKNKKYLLSLEANRDT